LHTSSIGGLELGCACWIASQLVEAWARVSTRLHIVPVLGGSILEVGSMVGAAIDDLASGHVAIAAGSTVIGFPVTGVMKFEDLVAMFHCRR